jgi:hypothetical protein
VNLVSRFLLPLIAKEISCMYPISVISLKGEGGEALMGADMDPESFGSRISKTLPMFRSYYELTSFGMSCKMKATRTS